MKIYLAGPCDSEHRSLMKSMEKLVKENFQDAEIYCPFNLKIENAWDYSQSIWAQKVFAADIQALIECNLMIMISFGRESSAGVNWEQGFAWANAKKIFVLQVTDQPTSLMTYCGCYNFYNTGNNINSIKSAIRFIAQNWQSTNLQKSECETVLT